ncbi:ATP-binding mismatch repair protein [Paramarasmius palmivorus]|uniref:ATP-binding mismatch repair protein n=1 Tax=Paramarasmius palmivorus TaxID=297713 RepID=A0AAW0BUM7_9AGAR
MSEMDGTASITKTIKAIDASSVHQITSGQVVIDLQTAVKELVENSLDAGATSIEVRFKNYGLKSIEVIDNGSGIPEKDFDDIGRKHHTSKLSTFEDLTTLTSFGFRGEAISSLCALCEGVTVTTTTADKAPMGTVLDLGKAGDIKKKAKASRQRGTTVLLTTPFVSLPVRRKELERNIKREFGKALALLNAYALGPCCGLYAGTATDSDSEVDLRTRAVRFVVSNQPEKGPKTNHITLPLPSAGAAPSVRSGIIALWGTKALDNVIDLALEFDVPRIKPRRLNKRDVQEDVQEETFRIRVKGLISFPVPVAGSSSVQRSGRTSTDRQFFYVNGRPCTLTKVQKVVNETYKSYTASNSSISHFPFIVADFNVPGDAVDVNVTPDKRTILVHAEVQVLDALKTALEELFSPSRSTYNVNGTLRSGSLKQSLSRKDATSSSQSKQIALQNRDQGENSSSSRRSLDQASRPVVVLSDGETNQAASNTTKATPVPHQTQAPMKDVMDVDQETSAPAPSVQGLSSCDASGKEPLIPSISILTDHSPASAIDEPSGGELPRSSERGCDKRKGDGRSEVVVSTTEASWTRKVAASSQHDEGAGVGPDTSTGGRNGRSDNDLDDAVEDEPPRKKRRSVSTSETGIAGGRGNVVSSYGVGKGKGRTTGQPTLGPTKQLTLTDAFKGSNTRQVLRAQLAGFARSGSQIPASPILDTPMDEDIDDVDVEQRKGGSKDDMLPPQRQDTPLFLPEVEDTQPEDETMDIDAPGTSSTDVIDSSSSISVPPTSLSLGSSTNNSSSSNSDLIDLTLDDDAIDGSLLASIDPQAMSQQRRIERVDRPEVIRTSTSTGDIHLRVDMTEIAKRWKMHRVRLGGGLGHSETPKMDVPGGDASADDNPEATLSRVIRKADFGKMSILGQFNLGFIIVRKREEVEGSGGHTRSVQDDLFIVDQHAADEKYNFESLQQACNIKSQKLIRPLPLDLTVSDEMLISENLGVLKQNGFEVEVQSQPEGVVHDSRPSRLQLTALPMSKGTVFDMKGPLTLSLLIKHVTLTPSVWCRLGRADTFDARSSLRPDGPMFQGPCYVRIEGLQEKRHGRHATYERSNDHGGSAYGDHVSAVELPSWETNNEAPVRHVKLRNQDQGAQFAKCRLAGFWLTKLFISIQPVLRIKSGEIVTIDCLDASNGTITPQSNAETVATIDISQVDQVNGPIYIEGARPGDTLKVDVISVETAEWGWTALIPGFGLLADEFPEPALKIWSLNKAEGFAYFDKEKGIKIPLKPFPGEMGVAQGQSGAFSTIPPYHTGGNLDTKHLTAGSTLYLPIEVEGALFSIGDGHAAQGDGGTAIETPMKVQVCLTVVQDRPYTKTPHFETSIPGQHTEEYYGITGVGPDIKEAAQAAVRHTIQFLHDEHGLSAVEAYMLCSVAGDLRMHEVVDMPNYVTFLCRLTDNGTFGSPDWNDAAEVHFHTKVPQESIFASCVKIVCIAYLSGDR